LRAFSKVIAVSRASQTYLLSRGIKDAEVIYNSVDTGLFVPLTAEMRRAARAELGLAEHDFVVLILGRLDSVKNSEFLCQFALRNHRELGKIVFVGDGPDLHKFREASAATEGRVQFVGFQPERETYMRAANVFLSASRSEGMPLSVLEAIASGLPCVLSDIPAHREVKQWIERLDSRIASLIIIVNGQEAGYLAALTAMKEAPAACETSPTIERELSARRMAEEYCRMYEQRLSDGRL
jgi:glycosyltransferase involved in cell wall biosynthesis